MTESIYSRIVGKFRQATQVSQLTRISRHHYTELEALKLADEGCYAAIGAAQEYYKNRLISRMKGFA